MTTLDQTNRDTAGAIGDLSRIHATLRALAARVHCATRPPGGTPHELRTLARQIDHLRTQVRSRQADDLRLWLENLRHRVESHLAADSLALADESHTPRDFPASTLA